MDGNEGGTRYQVFWYFAGCLVVGLDCDTPVLMHHRG